MIVGITNQKGGVGKTAIAHNLSAALDQSGKKILLIDFDPQASLTKSILGRKNDIASTRGYVRNFYHDTNFVAPLKIGGQISFVGSDEKLSGIADRGIDAIWGLQEGLEEMKDDYDYVIIDSLPSMGSLFLAVLKACDAVLIPVVPEFQVLNGLNDFFNTVETAKKRKINPDIKVAGIVFSMVESHKRRMQAQIMDELKDNLDGLIWDTKIYKRVSISEAPGFQMNVFDYEPDGPAPDYFKKLAKEFIQKMEDLK